MWLVSCRRQGMLTQGSASDPKCKLNISSFLTLPRGLDCPICTRNSVSIVLLLWMMGGWDRWGEGVDSHQGVRGGTGGGYYLIVFCFFFICGFVFWSLMSSVLSKWVDYDIAVVSVSLFIICFLCLWSL